MAKERGGPEEYKQGLSGRKIRSKGKGRGLGKGEGKGPRGVPIGSKLISEQTR
jgi:hypothetical protein